MALDIFFSEDIRNALMAANEASSATAAVVDIPNPTLRAYRQGYRAALATVALAFGLSPAIIGMPAPNTTDIPTILMTKEAVRQE